MNALSGKVILVTGGTSGLGRATSLALAEAGAQVIFTGRNETGADETHRRLAAKNLAADFRSQDVTNEEQWIDVVEWIRTRYGNLHGLVNNAGVSRLRPVERLSSKDVQFLLSVNVEGMFLGIKHTMSVIGASGGGAM